MTWTARSASTDVLGFVVNVYGPPLGLQAAFLAPGDHHHHVALNTWLSAGGPAAPDGCAGLHHVAFLYPGRAALAAAVRRVLAHDYPIHSAADHGGSVAVYLRDPDENGVELYYDRPRAEWLDVDGGWMVKSDPIDVRDLLAEER